MGLGAKPLWGLSLAYELLELRGVWAMQSSVSSATRMGDSVLAVGRFLPAAMRFGIVRTLAGPRQGPSPARTGRVHPLVLLHHVPAEDLKACSLSFPCNISSYPTWLISLLSIDALHILARRSGCFLSSLAEEGTCLRSMWGGDTPPRSRRLCPWGQARGLLSHSTLLWPSKLKKPNSVT